MYILCLHKIGPESDQTIGSELQNALSNYVIIFGNITWTKWYEYECFENMHTFGQSSYSNTQKILEYSLFFNFFRFFRKLNKL